MKEKKGSNRGRPVVHDEPWQKVTVVLLDRQIAELDRVVIDMRLKHRKAIWRADLIRVILDAVKDSGYDLSGCSDLTTLSKELARAIRKGESCSTT